MSLDDQCPLAGLPTRAVLLDGTPVCMRAIRADEKERLRVAFARLSPRSVYHRFFHPVNELSSEDLRRLTEIDFVDHVAVVLTVTAGSDERLIAVGRYVRTVSGGDTAEVAFTVVDDYQGRGAAGLLLRELADIARTRGIRKFVALVLKDNRPMLDVFRRARLPYRESMVDGMRSVDLDLTPAAAVRRPARRLRRVAEVALIAAAAMCAPASQADVTTSYQDKPPTIVSYRNAVARAAASVVTVHSAHASRSPLPLAPKTIAQGLGSGVIVDRDGYIVTNYHVIEEASQLAVARMDGTLNAAQVVGADPAADLALLKIDADGLQPIEFADINDVAVGDVVLAVGNPFGIGQTVTQGIVSAIVRRGTEPIDNFVQTDAAINPGNSGGALIDTAGRLIGINTVILSKSGGSEGIGFAIPGDLVQTVVAALKAKGRVARSWLGMSAVAGPAGDGALVVGVERSGPANRAGIAPGDLIVRVGDKPVRHVQDVNTVAIGNEPGTHVAMDIVRNGKRSSVDVQLAPIPDGETK